MCTSLYVYIMYFNACYIIERQLHVCLHTLVELDNACGLQDSPHVPLNLLSRNVLAKNALR